jgi:hypothetical protein
MVRVLAGSPRHSKTHRAAFVSPAVTLVADCQNESTITAESARAQPDSPGVSSHDAEAIRVDRVLLNGATPWVVEVTHRYLMRSLFGPRWHPRLIHKT